MPPTLLKLRPQLDWGLLAALIVPLVALLPLLTHAGLPNTADGPAHLMRQVELNRAWSEGNFYPRWGTDLAHGHGMPIFSYAPPYLYQLTQLFHLTGLELDDSMKAVVVFNFFLYSGGMFLFVRRLFGPYPALFASGLYVYAPYRLREAYVQGNYGQFSGLAFYPLIFWAFHGLLTDGRLRYWIAAPLALAGLLFSHNISFMIFVPLFGVYLLFLIALNASEAWPTWPTEQRWLKLAGLFRRPVTAGLLGLGLAAIFWLPAFGERHDIQLEGITEGFFDFRENFIRLSELLAPPVPLDLTAINPEFPLSLGLAQYLAAAFGGLMLLLYLRRPAQLKDQAARRRWANGIYFAAFLLLYAFLALPASQILWETIPLIELAEFPWRMLGPAIFCAAVLGAAGWRILSDTLLSQRKPNLWLAGAIALIIGLNAHYLYPSQYIVWHTPTIADAFAYEVASGAIGTTSTGEFLPRWAEQHPSPTVLWPDYEAGRLPQKLDPASLPPGATVENLSHQAEADSLSITTPTAFTATFRTLYWPGWQVYLNGQAIPFSITPQTGLIQATIPAGQHHLTLQLNSTPLRQTGLGLSLLSVIIWLIVLGLHQRNRWPTPSPQAPPSPAKGTALQPRTFISLTVLVLGLYLASRPLEPLFVLRSPVDRPQPAASHPQVDFGQKIRLVGVDAWPNIIQLNPNGQLDLTPVLYWRTLHPLETDYSVFLHLDTLDGQTWASVDEGNPENIPTGNWPPTLYLRNPLHLTSAPDGPPLPPIRYELTTGLYHPETGQRLPLADGSTKYRLGSLWLTPAQAPALGPVQATFHAEDHHLSLHHINRTDEGLELRWQLHQSDNQATLPNYSIFIHLLDDAGQLIAQADGVPYNGLYPIPHWLPQTPVIDARALSLPPAVSQIAIGVYNPATALRLTALTPSGSPLPNNAFVLPLTALGSAE